MNLFTIIGALTITIGFILGYGELTATIGGTILALGLLAGGSKPSSSYRRYEQDDLR